MPAQGKILSDLVTAVQSLVEQEPIRTRDFCEACTKLEPFFDNLGTLFHFAKHELVHKKETVVAVQDNQATLPAVFAAEKQAGTHTKKHSPARNLHRLAVTLEFMVHVFDHLIHDDQMLLRTAVALAYDATLAPIHYWAVRTAVKAGLLSLPTKEHFFEAIGETVESGRSGGIELVTAAKPVVQRLHVIFDGVDMPCSDVKWLPSFTESRKGSMGATQ